MTWSGKDEYRIGGVQCEPVNEDGSFFPPGPRYVARKQLQTLQDMGYKLLSACEIEARINHADTGKPVFYGHDIYVHELFTANEALFFKLDKFLERAGVNVGHMHAEWGSGQFEWAMEPIWGVEVADKVFTLKQAIKEVCQKEGYEAWFTSVPAPMTDGSDSSSNGCHFNHSLWDTDGRNAFLDENDKDLFSKVGRHWLGGLIRHGRAICAISAPTVNCYRRFNIDWTPGKLNWGFDDRFAAIRVKTTAVSSKGPFIENRNASGSCNPYLMLAATVAAGIDGIKNAIEPPAAGDFTEKVPLSLAEALDALEADKVMCDALGEECVRWFVNTKRSFDLKELADTDLTKQDAETLKKENEYYKFL